MTQRTVRWGRSARLAAATGALAVPALLAGSSLATPGSPAAAPSSAAPSVVSSSAVTPGTDSPGTPSAGKPDRQHLAHVLKDRWGDARSDAVSRAGTALYRAQKDPGALSTVTKAIGAQHLWGQQDASGRALTGQGVTVALVDSGVAPVPGLNSPGKLYLGPDLSLESGSESLRDLDSFGHGTHLAGIIAGRDVVPRDPRTGEPQSGPTDQLGVAPDAGLLSLKLASANGSTDVSQVIAGLDWVSQHARDNGMNVRVVNLSFGTASLQDYQVDPLAAAAENAWRHGIVVVVSGGNDGQGTGRLTDPAIDPYVIAVGASDPQLAVRGWQHPVVADFSQGGSAARHVDLLAPGRSITSLRDPGSFVDTNFPEGRVAGDSSGRLFRGSGTSQAAAVVSGAAALLVQADPTLTPDQVKAALTSSADPIDGVSPLLQGAGEIDLKGALKAVQSKKDKNGVRTAVQFFPAATGTGSLEAARGGSHLADTDGTELTGEVDVQGTPFDSVRWSALSAAGAAWTGGVWNSVRWSGADWASTGWDTVRWSSARWSSVRWSSVRWSSVRWSDADWDSVRWSSVRWSDANWDSVRWSSVRWSDAGWDSVRWSAENWG